MRARRIVVAASVLAVVAGGFAAYRLWAARAENLGLVVDPDPITFPTARWGDRVQTTCRVTNRSNRRALVKDPTFSCGCLRVDRAPPFSTMEPGASYDLTIIIETAQSGQPGRFHKEMTIVSDDPVHPKVVVPIVGQLRAYRKIEPRSVSLGTVDPAASEPTEKKVEIRGGEGFTVTLLKAEADDKKRVSVEGKPVKDGVDLLIRSVAGAPKGSIGVQVRITLRILDPDGESETVNESVWVAGQVK